jgi:NAD(P)-dependent dehydrogenase (short-subunit alcohol dehydrogenase family)
MKKRCIITGGTGFLGRQYCQEFIKNGYFVFCVDINQQKLKNIKKIYKKKIEIINCNISSEESVRNMYKKIGKNKYFDVIINNAAIDAVPYLNNSKFNKYASELQWQTELNVGLKGAFFMIKYFGEIMYKHKSGSIINIGSDLSVVAPNNDIYKTSYKNYVKPITYSIIKHGLLGLTKYYASIYAKNKVRVNMVSPGPVLNKQKSQLVKELKKIIPMKRLASPKDLFGIIKFLAGEESTYITGQNIVVDGGKVII